MEDDSSHQVFERQVREEDFNASNTTTETKPGSMVSPRAVRLIQILAGSLGATVLLTIALAAVVVVMVIWGVRTKRRRRVERDLVLRTKHDIFEGVSNAVSCETDHGREMAMHNVIDSSPERTVNVSSEEGGCGDERVESVGKSAESW